MAEHMTALQRGEQFIGLLKNDSFVTPTIFRDSIPGNTMSVLDEHKEAVLCKSFVRFSHEAIEAFPGSYIPPAVFQRELEGGMILPGTLKYDEMVGDKEGTLDHPAYEYKPAEGHFSLTVLHGATNDKAISLTRIAKEGFTPENRANYQQAVADMIKPAIADTTRLRGTLRIHDDCLASTVSIAGYLADLIDQKSDLVRDGIDIIIDGPATAQGILFLKKFAEVNNIKITVTASFLAFGLTEGVPVDGKEGVREHANYITLPDELFANLSPRTRKKYTDFSRGGSNRQVVGDMGTASQGNVPSIIESMKKSDGLGDDFNSWNNGRTDSHHDNNSPKAKVQIDEWDDTKPVTNVYFPRGGYIAYAYDKTFNPNMFKTANTLMIGASRLWSPDLGYGVAYGVEK